MTSGSILPALGTEPVVTVVTVKIHCADTVLGFRDTVQLTVAVSHPPTKPVISWGEC
jgi:hypothetical protein